MRPRLVNDVLAASAAAANYSEACSWLSKSLVRGQLHLRPAHYGKSAVVGAGFAGSGVGFVAAGGWAAVGEAAVVSGGTAVALGVSFETGLFLGSLITALDGPNVCREPAN